MSSPLPEYASPPVIEVVCGVRFASIDQFKAIHLGLLWERLKSGFPNVEEQLPLAIAIEQLEMPSAQSPEFQFVTQPPLPRVWFVDERGNGIIQVQRDTFLHNWRKLKPEDQYPRFRNVVASFKSYLGLFATFLEDHGLGKITPIQCELTYVNHIPEGPIWSRDKSLGNLFPDFAWRETPDRFLPIYEALNWRTAYRLPERQGRLHVTKQLAFLQPSGDPIVALEFKARGIAGTASIGDIWPWFETAHEWIVRGFTDITGEKAQKELWGRTR